MKVTCDNVGEYKPVCHLLGAILVVSIAKCVAQFNELGGTSLSESYIYTVGLEMIPIDSLADILVACTWTCEWEGAPATPPYRSSRLSEGFK